MVDNSRFLWFEGVFGVSFVTFGSLGAGGGIFAPKRGVEKVMRYWSCQSHAGHVTSGGVGPLKLTPGFRSCGDAGSS